MEFALNPYNPHFFYHICIISRRFPNEEILKSDCEHFKMYLDIPLYQNEMVSLAFDGISHGIYILVGSLLKKNEKCFFSGWLALD